jgi:hypothetical protein
MKVAPVLVAMDQQAAAAPVGNGLVASATPRNARRREMRTL